MIEARHSYFNKGACRLTFQQAWKLTGATVLAPRSKIPRAAAILLYASLGLGLSQPTLQITSPADGTVVRPGQSLTVTVSASPAGAFDMMTITAQDPIPNGQVLGASPYQFTIQIPNNITPGQYTLTADGTTGPGNGASSDPITIIVERADVPQSLVATPSILFLLPGQQGYIHITGLFADGTTTDLTKSTLLTHTSDASVETVAPQGIVTPIAPGSGTVVAHYGSLSVAVHVTVPYPLSIAPRQKDLYASEPEQFVAQTTALSAPTVNWSINPPGVGTIDGTGQYTAPSSISTQQTVYVTATNAADNTQSATATVTLFPPIAVTVTPASVNLSASQTRLFSAAVNNTLDADVTWSISPSGAGTIDDNGWFTAPATIPSPQTVTITATSVTDNATSNSATVTLIPANTPPTADSVTPNSGSGASQSFAFKYSSVNGYSYLSQVFALINSSLNSAGGCYAIYFPSSSALYLDNDAGTAWIGPLAPGAAGTLQNSQCTINGPTTTATGSGNTLTLTLAVAFKPSFLGLKTLFGYALDNGSLNSGWQTLGTWTPSMPVNTPPTADSVTPNSGSGTSQSFAFKYSSVNGYGYLNQVFALINGSQSSAGGCYAIYFPSTNALYLDNDAGTAWIGPLAPGAAGTLQNSQCTINGPTTTATGSGNTLTLTLAVAFKPSFLGLKTLFGYALDNGSLNSGWQTLGTWTPSMPVNTPPTADSVTPNSGSGASQNFAFKYSSVNGYGYLNQVFALINGSQSSAGGCYAIYFPSTNALYLDNDAGTAWIGPLAPGAAGTLQNSQCTINGPTTTATGSGNALTLTLAVSFKASFAATQTLFGLAYDNGGLNSGWQTLGTWTSH